MALAIFGISNNGLNLAVTLFVLMLVVVWLALIVYTYFDAKRRISDPFLVGCATIASFIPYIGTAVYAIVRPPEFLEDAHERELEIRAAELRVRQLTEPSCPNCEFPVEKNYLRCPEVPAPPQGPLSELRQAGRPALGALPLLRERRWRERPRRQRAKAEAGASPRASERRPSRARAARKREARPAAARAAQAPPPRARQRAARAPSRRTRLPNPKRHQRSPSREPDPDPRQA